MMKLIFIILFFCSLMNGYGQKKMQGNYYTPWGSEIILYPNNKFEYKSFECYHMVTALGEWSILKDTIFLTTLRFPFDSITEIEYTQTEISNNRITVTDNNNNLAYFTNVLLFKNNDTLYYNTDTLGFVDYNLNLDSIQIGKSRIILKNMNSNYSVKIIFENINTIDTEYFNHQPFYIKRKKLYYISFDSIDKKKYFKKQKKRFANK